MTTEQTRSEALSLFRPDGHGAALAAAAPPGGAPAEIVLWDRRPDQRSKMREAFRLFAEVGRRTSNRVAGSLARARIVLDGGGVAALCEPAAFPVVASAERAIADAVRDVFGAGASFRAIERQAA